MSNSEAIPDTMRALVSKEPKTAEVKDIPVPKPADGEILVKVHYAVPLPFFVSDVSWLKMIRPRTQQTGKQWRAAHDQAKLSAVTSPARLPMLMALTGAQVSASLASCKEPQHRAAHLLSM